MILITGPQQTPDERGDLAESAGLYGARLVCDDTVQWAEAELMLCLPGWEFCPLAIADVAIAESLVIPRRDVVP
ncbi:hypothetical protein [Streptomyces sp. NPDC048603]|uniref:hypothetical protein n=1 Tax=Streptomyces sp. NPDC048603 TaxID=3365577 RepID=UPI00371B9940